jgi:Sap, sulfolipid-1-addressing protein
MIALALLVASIAVADSINPSTVIPALWICRAPRGRGLGSYALGVFAVYLAGGLLLVLGPGATLIAALHHIGATIEHVLLAAGGIVALGFAIALWRSSRGGDRVDARSRRCYTRPSAFTLGAGIMAIELPTAFMYFGAISAILAARPHPAIEILLLVVYNTVFVAPLVAILAIRRLAAGHAERWLVAGEERLRRVGRLALPAFAGAGGAALLVIGLGGLLAA